MPRLIIGHTTQRSTRIWLRGSERYPVGFVTLRGSGIHMERRMRLEARHGFTGTLDFAGLEPRRRYTCSVAFGQSTTDDEFDRVEYGHCSGRLRTFPDQNTNATMKFMLGSCNLHSLGFIQSPDPAYKRLARIASEENADFMIHCGDQIYYDIPNYLKSPQIEEYRDKYLDAWGDSRPTRKFLTMLPHYMILDDHEMTNNFSNDMDARRTRATPDEIKLASLKVYREFQHIRNPQSFGNQALYYMFSFGKYQFFVMDTRTERDLGRCGNTPRIISREQMRAFKRWLSRHAEAMKFVVTSVPFVAEPQGSDDKWNAPPFRRQREEIIAHVMRNGIEGLTFLTGDMHNSYHAELRISDEDDEIVVHELMSSPINQISKSSFDAYERGRRLRHASEPAITYTTNLRKREFYNDHSNAMLISVTGRRIRFEVFRTKKERRDVLTGSFTA